MERLRFDQFDGTIDHRIQRQVAADENQVSSASKWTGSLHTGYASHTH